MSLGQATAAQGRAHRGTCPAGSRSRRPFATVVGGACRAPRRYDAGVMAAAQPPRARPPPGHPHRARRQHHGAGRLLGRRPVQQPQRRGGAQRRLNVVHRPELRHRQRLRGPRRTGRGRRLRRLPHRPRRGRVPPRRGRLRETERPRVLPRRAAAPRRRHPAQPHRVFDVSDGRGLPEPKVRRKAIVTRARGRRGQAARRAVSGRCRCQRSARTVPFDCRACRARSSRRRSRCRSRCRGRSR